jgi:hypothetical protein
MPIDMLKDPDGFRRSAGQLEGLMAAVTGAASPAVRLAALELERGIKTELSMPGSGREYKRGRKTHVASAPGLEFGTLKEGGFIAPRPFMRPALAKTKDKMTGVVVDELRRSGPGE